MGTARTTRSRSSKIGGRRQRCTSCSRRRRTPPNPCHFRLREPLVRRVGVEIGSSDHRDGDSRNHSLDRTSTRCRPQRSPNAAASPTPHADFWSDRVTDHGCQHRVPSQVRSPSSESASASIATVTAVLARFRMPGYSGPGSACTPMSLRSVSHAGVTHIKTPEPPVEPHLNRH